LIGSYGKKSESGNPKTLFIKNTGIAAWLLLASLLISSAIPTPPRKIKRSK